MDWEKYSFVVRSKNRKKVLKNLDSPKTPSQLREKTGINLSHISRALSELKEEGIVKCLTPNQKLGRVYKRTEVGEEIAEDIAKKEEKHEKS